MYLLNLDNSTSMMTNPMKGTRKRLNMDAQKAWDGPGNVGRAPNAGVFAWVSFSGEGDEKAVWSLMGVPRGLDAKALKVPTGSNPGGVLGC